MAPHPRLNHLSFPEAYQNTINGKRKRMAFIFFHPDFVKGPLVLDIWPTGISSKKPIRLGDLLYEQDLKRAGNGDLNKDLLGETGRETAA